MKTKIYFFLIAFIASTVCTWAQNDMSSGKVDSRMAVSADELEVAIRRVARRKIAAVNWSYPTAAPSSPFAGGTGGQDSPYQIATAQQLANFSYLVNTNSAYRSLYYELTNDIVLNQNVLNEDRSLNAVGAAWTPIGSSWGAFSGHFNGNGYSVKGIYIYTTQEFTGLFGYVTGATIENLGVEDGYIYGCCRTGGIVGYAYNSTIQNCFNTNTMYSKSSLLGGIVGNTSSATKIIACYNAGKIYCYGQYCDNHGRNGNCVAGVAGAIDEGGSISYCYNTGSVYGGAYYSAGVCNAHNSSGPVVTSCHNVGTVSCYNSNSTGAVIAASGGYYFTIRPSYSKTYGLALSSPVHQYSTVQSETEFADGTVLKLLDSEGLYFKQGEKYPVLNYVKVDAQQPEEQIEAEGQCGNDVWWRLTSQGELIISGVGPMYNYGTEAVKYIQKAGPQIIMAGIQKLGIEAFVTQIKSLIEKDPSGMGLAPWINYSSKIRKITVEKGVTTIAQGAFLLLTNATEASIPSTIEQLGAGAFGFCTGLTNLYSYAVLPPVLVGELSEYTFCYTANTHPLYYNNPSLCTLHVSQISLDKYAEAEGWKLFQTVTNELEVDWDPVLSLTDDNSTLVAETYKAGNITYTRSGEGVYDGCYASFCLPFDVDLSATDAIRSAYVPLEFVFYNEKDSMLSLFFKEQTGVIAAGTPFLAQLNGDEVVLANCTETTLSEYMDALTLQLPVFEYTSIGGIMKPNSSIGVHWNGTYTAADKGNAGIFSSDGSMSMGNAVPVFRTYVAVVQNGVIAVKGIKAIVDSPADEPAGQEEEPEVELGDMDGDGFITVTDITLLINKYLKGEAKTRALLYDFE